MEIVFEKTKLGTLLLAELYREDNGENTNHIYPNQEELIQDIATAYQTVIQDLYHAGCRNIQFDDCTWGILYNIKIHI